jgi:TRAP-type C4-dicarboxylate transport system permease small subunit
LITAIISKTYNKLVDLCAAVVGLMIILAVIFVVIDVAGRYFFSSPIGWVLEATEYILLSIPFLAMAWLVRKAEGHVRIELLVQALPQAWQNRLNIFSSLLASSACGLATYYAVETTIDHFLRNIVTPGIYPIPKFTIIAIVSLGLGLTTIEFLRKAILILGEKN